MVHKYNNFFTRMMNQNKTVSPVTNCLNTFCSILVQLVSTLMTLKIIILYVQGCEKRKLKHIITDQNQNRTENLFFHKSRQMPIYQAAVEPWDWNSFLSSIDDQLSSFNDRHFFSLFLGQTRMILTLDLETQFLEVLNTSQIYPNTSKVCFVKELANYIKQ